MRVLKRDKVREYIREHAKEYLEPDKSKKGYVCPLCASGTGEKGTGITTKDGIHFTCWAGCFTHEDIIDIIGRERNLTDYTDKLKAAAEEFNIEILEQPKIKLNGIQQIQDRAILSNMKKAIENTPVEQDITIKKESHLADLLLQAQKDIARTDYLEKRGISLETARKLGIGYTEKWSHGTGKETWKALVIPLDNGSLEARNTAPNTGKENRYRKYGTTGLFNADNALYNSEQPCFVVEGAIDALSVIEAGGNALALTSTVLVRDLIKKVTEKKPSVPLVLALDNDESGEKASKILSAKLESENIPFVYFGKYSEARSHDPNSFLLNFPEQFKKEVKEYSLRAKEAAQEIEAEEEAKKEAERKEYMKNSSSSHLWAFMKGIAESVSTEPIKTGFSQFDKVLEGGLHEGLYFIGAISSLGKTTFALQIGDQIAEAGQDVLIISLEMARSELMAKSISRHTLEISMKEDIKRSWAKSSLGITTGSRYSHYCKEEKGLIQNAVNEYSEYAKNIFIFEGVGDLGVKEVRSLVNQHYRLRGKRPVVIIDYIQILAAYNDKMTDKQNTDKNVMELKRIARDYKVPIIGVSSLNRASYKDQISMEAFKESGAIEYSSDVLIGLQLEGAGTKGFDVNEAKRRNPRDIELIILKNRQGRTGEKIPFTFYPIFNYFDEA